MRMVIINQTKYLYGGNATTILVNEFVNAQLGNYGPGVERIDVTVVYPPKTRPGRSPGGFSNFWKMVSKSPQATFFRTKQRIDVRCVCRDVSVRSIESGGHLTLQEVNKIATTVASALELIRPKVRLADRFDCDSFLRDAKSALLELPTAIQQVLKPE